MKELKGRVVVKDGETFLICNEGRQPVACQNPLPCGDLVRVQGNFNGSLFNVSEFQVIHKSRVPWQGNPPDFLTTKLFSAFLQETRNLFVSRSLTEVYTPTLVCQGAVEPLIEPFESEFKWGSKTKLVQLSTSPELYLKKMLTQGWENIFELKWCFRNGDLGKIHQPEFLMLEWYRAYGDLNSIFDDLQSLMFSLAPQVESLKKVTMADLFDSLWHFKLEPDTPKNELFALAAKLEIFCDKESDSWGDVFSRLLLVAEKDLMDPTVLYMYPPQLPSLAKIDSSGWVHRFELYWNGIELCNGYNELTDVDEYLKREKRYSLERAALGLKPHPVDPDFVEAMQLGIPPSAGAALGMERLFMQIHKLNSFCQWKSFEFKKTNKI